jgi:hypothetical protein
MDVYQILMQDHRLSDGCELLQHRVVDRADQIRRDVDTVEIPQMADGPARAHASRVHRDDLVAEPWEAALILLDDQHRNEAVKQLAGSLEPRVKP